MSVQQQLQVDGKLSCPLAHLTHKPCQGGAKCVHLTHSFCEGEVETREPLGLRHHLYHCLLRGWQKGRTPGPQAHSPLIHLSPLPSLGAGAPGALGEGGFRGPLA